MADTITTNKPAKSPKVLADKTAPVALKPAIADDQPAPRGLKVDVAKKMATATYSVKFAKADTDRYAFETVLDLSGVTEEELYQLACRSIVIDIQANIRKLGKTAGRNPGLMKRVDVKSEVVDAQRATGDDTTRLIRQTMRVLKIDEATARKRLGLELEAIATGK